MSGRSKLAMASCAALLAAFYLLGWFSFQTHSPTIDEPLHAAAAYQHLFDHDFRVDAEDPPLWQYWAMIPHHRGELLPGDPQLWRKQLNDPAYAAMITSQQLFETPGIDGAAFINRSRAIMLLIGVLLGAAIAAWAWQLAGPVAAVIACALFAFDPNFLGHSPLVKNDVSLSFLLFCAAWASWSIGKSGRWWNILLLCLLCGMAAATKFSGLIVLPIVGAILLVRVFMSRNYFSRLATTIALGIAVIAATYLTIWAAYGFRFGPTPSNGELLNIDGQISQLKQTLQYLREGRWSSEAAVAAMPAPPIAKVILFAQSHQ
ncbi:MAG TPA: hypothetical protein VKK61_00600, partial [Tepidisphaeraceae bacterium]|nr:hypothetical protein [Tepidisphaeraceae bacterium]